MIQRLRSSKMGTEFLGRIIPVDGTCILLAVLSSIILVRRYLLRVSCGKWNRTEKDGNRTEKSVVPTFSRVAGKGKKPALHLGCKIGRKAVLLY